METTEAQPEHAEQKKNNGRRSPRVLLGVTGSVAAVKAPEIACRLVDECGAHVKVLLSEGGRNFWEKAFEYDPVYWNRLQELLQQQQSKQTATTTASDCPGRRVEGVAAVGRSRLAH